MGIRRYVKKIRRGIFGFFYVMRRDYRRRWNMRLKQWLIYHHKKIVLEKCYWMGVRALKNPLDAWIYQEIIYEVQPDIIIEIGSWEGGSTLYFAHLLDLIGKGRVLSIDIDRTHYHVQHERIITLTGDSSSAPILSKVSELCEGKSVLVVHDGDHRKVQVLKDLRNYSKFVSLNSYLIVEDGIVDLFAPGEGPGMEGEWALAAVEEFLKENPDFMVDTERERYILTNNPRGYLRRISQAN